MADTDYQPQPASDAKLGYTQALKYGQDLARLYTLEKSKRRDLELANQKLKALLETAPNGLAVLDETMTIVETNPCFEALAEKNGSCVGHTLIDVLPCDEVAAAFESVPKEGKRLAEVEVTLTHPTDRTLHVIGAPLVAGDQRGWVVSLHDITERKRLEGLKEEFINIAAHELRTPLAIILGYATVLREDVEEGHNSVAMAAVDSIINAADRLTMVVDELVSFAAAKSRSNDDVAVDQIDLLKVIHHTVNSVAHQASLKNVALSVQSTAQPLMVNGDRVILAKVIGHLLDNAIKFNRPGGQIRVRASQVHDETRIEVKDTGIGIPLADLDKIFDMFYQVEEHMIRAQGGLGLGLAIAQRGVELHGGHISVESTLGQGSCFRVTLPSSAEPIPIPPQTRLDTAHQQTLAYGHDLARAVASKQALTRRLSQVSALGNQLLAHLERLSRSEASNEPDPELDEARTLARQLVQEANQQHPGQGMDL
jgi:two-component system phosphate regulon sensor histidine kinase PhoR